MPQDQPQDIFLDRSRASVTARITSPSPTRYEVVLKEERRYLYCAFDALLLTHLRQERLELRASPPVGAPFTLRLDPKHLPGEPFWHSYVSPESPLPEAPGMASRRCPYLHLFTRREDAQAWYKTLAPHIAELAELIPLEEAWQRAKARVAGMTKP